MADDLQTSEKQEATTKSRAVSKLSLLVAFIAGAFAAWIIIAANIM